MVKVSAFKALRPINELVDKVPTKPYVNYSIEEILKEKKHNQYSFLNIIHQHHIQNLETRFKKIRLAINDFKNRNIFMKDEESYLYVYQQSKGKKKYTGLICAIDLKDYKNNKIKIHEKTIKKREILFSKYLQITKIHAEPVLITYDQNTQYIKTSHMCQKNQLYDFTTKDNIQHQIWKISNPREIENIIADFKNIKNLYIADGHHRMASSSKLKKNHKCLAYILPKNELCNYPFHRVLSIPKTNQSVLKNIRKNTSIQAIKKPKKQTKNIQFYLDNKWYEISIEDEKDILKNLSVHKLLKNILKPIFSIKNERNSENIRFIPGNQSIHTILDSISETEILFLMNQINIETIIDIANQKKTTPPKSTFILPKIPSGLMMMELK